VVPTAGGPGDLRIAPNPPGVLPVASIINYQNFGVVANAADVPIGTGVRLFADGATTNFILDVMGYYRDVSCQAGTVKAQAQCWETALRSATDIFSASEACGGLPGRGRLGNGLQLRALNVLGTLALAAPPGEWTDNLYFDTSGAGFSVMTIANDNSFGVQDTLSSLPYRCVFNGMP
jgi:hypothetical protein